MEQNKVRPPAKAHSAVGLSQWSSPDCPDATSGLRDVDRIHPACFPMMEQNKVRPPAKAHSAVGLSQWSSPDCPDATSGLRDVDRIHPACFPMMEQNKVRPPAKAHSAVGLAQYGGNLPSCTDRLTVNCQPMCTESETVGCTETRSAPVNYPTRNWDYRDRYEGRITFERPILDNGTDAGYVRL